MALQKPCIALVFLLLASWTILVPAPASPDFDGARGLIKEASPNGDIDYHSFCSETTEGQQKMACHINKAPSVGFLVCKMPEYVQNAETKVPCKDVIANETQHLDTLNQKGVKTLTFSTPQIDNVKCADDSKNLACSGFLVNWVDKEVGEFQQIRNAIHKGTVKDIITSVRAFTHAGAALNKTIADLEKIKTFMKVAEDSYQQICDLKGFFLKRGEFLVSDVPDISKPADMNGVCWDREPTTAAVLEGIDEMIAAFKIEKLTTLE